MNRACQKYLPVLLAGFLGCVSGPDSSVAPSTSLTALEEAVLFQPSKFPEGDWKPKDLYFEDVWFVTDDGVRLNGWYCDALKPKAVVLYCHGNAGNVTSCYWNLRFLREKLGVSVLAFDYRGYGKSPGKPSAEGIMRDARAARRWLADRAGVAEKDIVLYGYSLGGAVAVDLAAEDGALALILESTFTSLPDLAGSKPLFAASASVLPVKLNSRGKIRNYYGPLLQAHGDADPVIPFNLGKKLFAAANGPRRFVRINGGGHAFVPTPEYADALAELFNNLFKEKTVASEQSP